MALLPSSPPLNAWRRVSLSIAAFQRAAASRLGINPADYHCLDLLLAGEPVTPDALIALTGYTPGAVTGVIDRLVRAGYARRVRDPEDGRRVIVEPVPEAIEQALAPVVALLAEAIGAVHEGYSEVDTSLVLDYLYRSETALEQATTRVLTEL